MNSQSATHSAFQLSLKNLLWALPILFLSFFQSQTSYAQTILIANGQAINVCSDSTVENITLLYAGAITRTNQRCTIQLPLGVLYISGSLTGTGGLAVSQFDISDLNRPIFGVANDPSGFNLSTFNYRRKANCDAAATGQDQITLTGTNTPGGNYVVNGNSNTYNINRAAFNFNSTLTGPFTIGSSVCRPIVIDNSGNGTIDRIFYSVDISDRISNYSLFLNNVELVAITETPTFNGVVRTYQLDNVDFDAGESITMTECFVPLGCDSSFPAFTQHHAQLGCDPVGTCPVTDSPVYAVTGGTLSPPTIINCPLTSIVLSADPSSCSTTLNYPQLIATDNCTPAIELSTQYQINGGGFLFGQALGTVLDAGAAYNIETSFTDGDGNVAFCFFTVNVIDYENPSAVCNGFTVFVDDACEGEVLASDLGIYSYDNCTPQGSLLLEISRDNVTFTNDLQFTVADILLSPILVTVRVTDVSGNSSTCVASVNVVDINSPLVVCPDPITVNSAPGQCHGLVPAYTDLINDNCGNTGSVSQNPVAGTNFGGADGDTVIVRLTFTDANNNSTFCDWIIELNDNQAPVAVSCPVNVTVNNNPAGSCSAVVTYATPLFSDNCLGTVPGILTSPANTASGSTFPVGTTLVTWEITDSAGLTATCSFSVTVIDNTAPVLVNCPANATIAVGASCNANVMVTAPTWSENCGIVSSGPGQPTLTISKVGVGVISTTIIASGSVSNTLLTPGTYIYLYTVVDVNGNSSSCQAIITVADQTAPVVLCPANVTLDADSILCLYEPTTTALNATASDNCSIASLTHDYNDAPLNTSLLGASFYVGTTNVTWTATDSAGNSSTCIHSITIIDSSNPNFLNCPNFDTLYLPAFVDQCQGTAYWNVPIADDACGTVSVVQSTGPANGSILPVGIYPISYTATDEAGNTSVCSFVLKIVDTQIPLLVCPPSITVGTDLDQCDWTSEDGALDASYNAENCPVAITYNVVFADGTFDSGSGFVPGSDFPRGVSTITYTITETADPENNGILSDSCSFTVTVVDQQRPDFDGTCSADLVFAPEATCDTLATLNNPLPIDNCGLIMTLNRSIANSDLTVTVANNVVPGAAYSHNFLPGVSTVTFTAFDSSGNSRICVFTVTVVDEAIPTVVCPADVTLYANANCEYIIAGDELDIVSSDDNCGIANFYHTGVIAPDQYTLNGGILQLGTTIVGWVVEDGAGNQAGCIFSATVLDTLDPVFLNCPADTIIVGNLTDNCDGAVNWSSPVAEDNCSVIVTQTSGPLSGSILNVGFYTIVYTATDPSGNTSTCSFVVSVIDTQDPLLVCPQNITISNNLGQCSWTYVSTQGQGALNPAVSLENCASALTYTINGPNGLNASGSGVISAFVFPLGVTTVCYTLTETGGNLSSATCCFTVTVADTEAPQILTCSASNPVIVNVNVNCSANIILPVPVATDNCTANLIYTAHVVNTSSGIDGNPIVVLDLGIFNAVGGLITIPGATVGSYIVTMIVADSVGNTSTCVVNVQVRDNIAPTFDACPGTVITGYANNANCTYSINPIALGLSASDNCDVEFIDAIIDGLFYASADLDQITAYPFQLQGVQLGVGSHAVVLTAYDFYGNSAVCNFSINVLDTIAPFFVNCPPDTLTVGNFVDNCVGSANWPIPVANDNCEVTVVQFAGPAYGTPLPVGFYTISYRAFDASGNADTCTFVLRIVDTQIPLVVCPQNITVDTDPEECTWTSPAQSLTLAVASENCPVAITWRVVNPNGSVTNGGASSDVSGYVFAKGFSTVCYFIIETTDPDSNGILSDSCCFSVLIEDNEMPTITCPNNITIGSDGGLCSAELTLTHPQANDNCGVQQLILVITNPDASTFGPITVLSGGTLPYVFQVGVSVVLYIAVDSSGNTQSCTYTVTVNDDEAPIIECVTSGAELPSVWINEFHYDNTGTDVGEFIEVAGTAGIDLTGYSLVLYNGANGLTYLPTKALTGIIPNQSNGIGTVSFAYLSNEIQNGAPDGIALVNGTTVLQFISYEGVFTALNGPANGMQSVDVGVLEPGNALGTSISKTGNGRTSGAFNWVVANTATPGALNTGQTIAPIPSGTSVFTFQADDECEFRLETDTLDPEFDDNCSAIIAHNYVFGPNSNTLAGSIFEPGTYIITWTATDMAGNTASCTITVIVVDETDPIFLNCPPDTLTVSNFVDNCVGSVVWSVPIAQDNCGAVVYQIQGPVPGQVLATGFYGITYVARDSAGNTDTCHFVLRVLDTQLPLVVCPQDITVHTDPAVCQWTSPIGSLTAAKAVENCPVATTWIVTNPDGSLVAGLNDVSGYTFFKGLSTVCYKLTETQDPEGNGFLSDSCCFTVVVEDRERPMLTCPESVTIGTDDGICEAEYTWTHPDPTDNCEIASLVVVFENPDGSVEDTLQVVPDTEITRIFDKGVTTITYVASDSSGNTRSCVWTVTVVDDESPIVYCDSLKVCNVFAAQNLPLAITPLSATSKIIIVNNLDITSVRIVALNVTPPPSGTLTYTLTSPAGTTIVVTGTAPQGPFPQFVGQNSNGNWTLTITSTSPEGCGSLNAWSLEICGKDLYGDNDNRLSVLKDADLCSYTVTDDKFDIPFSDNCPGATITHDWYLGPFNNTLQGAVFPVGISVVTWTAVDSAGNVTTCSLTIEVLDFTAPYFTNCPRPDIVEQTLADQCGAYINFSQPIAVDDCGGVTIVKTDLSGLQSGDFFPVGATILRWIATDESGNTALCSIKVIVQDQYAPDITCPASVTVGNDLDDCGAKVFGLAPTVTDNCTNNIGVVYKVEFPVGTVVESGVSNASGVFFEVGTSTVTYMAQDQPVLLISEITQDINAVNGGTMPVPAFINTINGNDFTEITNLGHAALNLSCLELVRWGANLATVERYTIPEGTVVQPGQVVTIHWGNGTDSPANRFFNAPCALDRAANAPQAYALIFEGIVLDVAAINNMNPANGVIPGVVAGDFTGGVGLITNHGGIYRKYEFDNNRAADFGLNDACFPGTIGALNPTLTAMTPNGVIVGLQKKKPNKDVCSFTVTVQDTQDPECGTLLAFNYNGGPVAIVDGKMVMSTINVPQNFEVGDVNLINVNGTHGNVGQLAFKLQSPEGTIVELFKNVCNGGVNFNFGLDSDTLNFINTAPCNPLGNGGSYKPLNSLVKFNGQSSLGAWKLIIADMAAGATGNLNGWTLQLRQRLAYAQGDTIINNEIGKCGANFMWFHPQLFDNCPGGTMVVNYYSVDPTLPVPVGGVVIPGTKVTQFFAVGTTIIEYTLTDAAGNTSQCSFQVIIHDVENPIVVCPANITINLQDGQCESVVSWLPALLTDNCSIDTFYSVPATGSIFVGGTTVVTIYVTDVNGNTSSCSFTVTVVPATSTGNVLACNDLVQISLGPDCLAEVTADMILEGSGYACYEFYQVIIGTGQWPGSFVPIPTSPILTLNEVGGTFTVIVVDPVSGNSCWGMITVEDKLNPEFECPHDTLLPCNGNLDPLFIGAPILLSCEASITVNYTDQVFDYGECSTDPRARVLRTWTVTDESGNSSVCTQEITFDDFELSDLVWPLDRDDIQAPSIPCEVVNGNPNSVDPSLTGAPLIAGKDFLAWDYCDASVGYRDEVLVICEGSYEILRTWTVRDICLPIVEGENPVRHTQIIRIKDKNGPAFINCQPALTISTLPYDCYAIWDANANKPQAVDACGSVIKYEIVGASFNNHYDLGVHIIRFRAKDACGNWNECVTTLTVIDDWKPVPVCDKPTTVALLQSGVARIFAYTFDDGSHDNCGIDSFAVRRMNPVPGCGIDTKFHNYVDFCCEDVAVSPVMVVLRVFDIHGNFNDCMVEVYVQDKVPPIIICPPSITVDCDYPYDVWNLSIFGTVRKLESDRQNIIIKLKDANGNYTIDQIVGKDGIAYDNCDVDITVTETVDIDNCGVGEIRRTFRATDHSGLSSSCTQIITVTNFHPFYVNPDHITQGVNYVFVNGAIDTVANEINKQTGLPVLPADADDIEWPADYDATTCGEALDPSNLPDGYDYPVVDEDVCSLVGTGYDDWYFNIQGEACLKIIRRWKVIDWCQFNPETGEYYVWTYDQIIKVKNHIAPVFVNCADTVICTYSLDCSPTQITLIQYATDDCTPEADLKWTYKIDLFNDGTYDVTSGVGSDASGQYPVNTANVNAPGAYHRILWTVEDGCGNKTTCEKRFRVADCKKPTPVCYNGLAADIMPIAQMVTVWANDFNASSFDNCTPQGKLKFSFSADTTEKGMTFDCEDLGTNIVQMWVTDEWGNQDFCETYIIIQDNNDACTADTTTAQIAGAIKTTGNGALSNADVQIMHNALPKYTAKTNALGNYFVGAPKNKKYEVKASRNLNPMNGVSTLDLVLIQKHILGVIPFTSIYQKIAADVNKSNTITAADLVELRRLILGKITTFTNNTSWRMVVPTSATVLADVKDTRTIDPLNSNMSDQDFMGIKVGDVSGNADPADGLQNTEGRSSRTLELGLDDRQVVKGQVIDVAFTATEFRAMNGYQFTMNFDPALLAIGEIQAASLKLTEENFGRSFLGKGLLTSSWNDNTSGTFNNDEVLFSVQMTVLQNGILSDLLRISSDYTAAEAYNANGEVMNVALRFNNSLSTKGHYELYQNVPNPFAKSTLVGFSLPKAERGTFTVYDINGKILKVIEKTFLKGRNEISLSRAELGAIGVLYYKVETTDWTATKKMVILE